MRVLLIGLGDIARKAYLPVLSTRADLDIHLATRDAGVLDEVGRSFRIAHRHTSAADALSTTAFDAAFVHASTQAHGELVRLLIERGVPTFVDKPSDWLPNTAPRPTYYGWLLLSRPPRVPTGTEAGVEPALRGDVALSLSISFCHERRRDGFPDPPSVLA